MQTYNYSWNYAVDDRDFNYYILTASLYRVDFNAGGIYEYYEDTYSEYWYDSGYNDGYDNGYFEGESYGYNQGKTDGEAIGREQATSVDMSVKGLLGVLIDSPILFLRKLFDYQLFGISIFGALATIVSLLVALSVFRLIRGVF